MYKTISIQNQTYQNLQVIASKMQKPKAKVIDQLVKEYVDSIKEKEEERLKEFNQFVKGLTKRAKLPKGAKINTQDMDKDFGVLKD